MGLIICFYFLSMSSGLHHVVHLLVLSFGVSPYGRFPGCRWLLHNISFQRCLKAGGVALRTGSPTEPA
jgi:hypothetical protein